MKARLILLFTLLGLFGQPLRAEETEWVVELGCVHCHFAEQTGVTTCKGNCAPAAMKDGKVLRLTGAAVPKDFKKGGAWLVKGALSADGKTIAVQEMTARPPMPADLANTPATPASPEARPYTGTVAHTGAGLPSLTVADKTVFHLKVSKSASTATRYMLTRIGGGELTGFFTAVGTTYEDDSHTWIVVDSIQAASAPHP